MTTGLMQEMARLIEEGKMQAGRPYSRSEIVTILSRSRPDTAESDIQVIRGWAQSGSTPGGLQIRTSGKKRGFKYHFATSAEDFETPSPTQESIGCPAEEASNTGPRASATASGENLRGASGTLLPQKHGKIVIHEGDNLPIMQSLPSSSVDLIYVDPPFNTGKNQARTQIATVRDENGDRTGFKGQRYRTIKIGTKSFEDAFDDYMEFLVPRLEEAYRLLKPSGSLFLHLDYREVHYAKVALDKIFGRECFVNEIIWAYDYGARTKKKWSAKHDNILWYAKDPDNYCFNFDEMDRIPYMAPGLVGKEKAARGKTPTDTWWHTIVSPNSHEKTGYPTQKPLGVLDRIVKVHTQPGHLVMDFFAGSGTLGESAAMLGRDAVLIDSNQEAIAVMRRRLDRFHPTIEAAGEPSTQQQGPQDKPVSEYSASSPDTQRNRNEAILPVPPPENGPEEIVKKTQSASHASKTRGPGDGTADEVEQVQKTLFDFARPRSGSSDK